MLILVLLEFLHGLVAHLLELTLVLHVNFALDACPLVSGRLRFVICGVTRFALNDLDPWAHLHV